MLAERFPTNDTDGMESSGRDRGRDLDDWVAELRRISLDNLRECETEGGRGTLRQRLFPLNDCTSLHVGDVLYSESLWAAGTLAVCFLAYLLATGSWTGATGFVLLASLTILPLLIVWAGLGYYYARKNARSSHSEPG